MGGFMTEELVILLSTDWFLPLWAEIGIELAEDKMIGIQQGCRDIVDQIIGECTSILQIDFSEQREQETNDRFLVLLRSLEAEQQIAATWAEWADLSHEKLSAAFCVQQMNREACLDDTAGQAPLDSAIRAEVIKTWPAYNVDPSRFGEICERSTTEWDIHARRIFNTPRTLGNQLWSVVLDRKLRAFWAQLRDRLTAQQIQELVAWYQAQAPRPSLIPSYIA